MMPPSASTSRTRCPLAMPPTAGLQDIWAIRSTLSVYSAVFRPIRAAAIAASQPACPAPTTTTSYFSEKPIAIVLLTRLKGLHLFYQVHSLEASTVQAVVVFSTYYSGMNSPPDANPHLL